MKDATLALHHGFQNDPTTKAVAVPIYQTVAYEFDNAQHGADLFNLAVPGNIYTRIMNPTQAVLEARVAAMEGGIAGLALASGMAAITYSIQTIAEAGDNIVSASTLYGGTYNLFAHTFPQMGIEVRFADPRDPAAFAALIDERTKAVFFESIGNPAGIDGPALLHTDVVTLSLQLGGLLNGNLNVDSVELVEPKVTLIRNADGAVNWLLNPDEDLRRSSLLSNVRLDQIQLSNGSFTIVDRKQGFTTNLSTMDATMSADAIEGPWRLKGTGYWRETPMAFTFSSGVRVEPTLGKSGLG